MLLICVFELPSFLDAAVPALMTDLKLHCSTPLAPVDLLLHGCACPALAAACLTRPSTGDCLNPAAFIPTHFGNLAHGSAAIAPGSILIVQRCGSPIAQGPTPEADG